MISDRGPRRALEESASLTAPAARNRAPPSVLTEKSGHLAMRHRGIPGASICVTDSTGMTAVCNACHLPGSSSQRLSAKELRAVTRDRNANFAATMVSSAKPSPALILYLRSDWRWVVVLIAVVV
jgi:hypothetical protein